MASTNPARGMRDFLPADVRKRNYVINIIKEVYESYGFEPLETPAVENLETLLGKYGEEGNQLVFKVLKRGEKLKDELRGLFDEQRLPEFGSFNQLSDLALRYDLTVPLARVVANNKNDLPKFFKRYQIQPVWRADRPARGRFREFYQCDVDFIGSDSRTVEAELISAISTILILLEFNPFAIKLNHRHVLTGILDTSGVSSDRHADFLVTLDKFDKLTTDAMIEEFRRKGITGNSMEQIFAFFNSLTQHRLSLLNDEASNKIEAGIKTLDFIDSFIGDHKKGKEGTFELREILELLRQTPACDNVLIEPILARGLSYYTGAIMEIEALATPTNPAFVGSLGGGGRYDGLIGMFGKEQIPACGFSLGLERILVVMEERGMFPPEIAEATPADVMVTIGSKETAAESLKLATELRAIGLRVTVYPQPDKEEKQWKYANSIGVPWFCSLTEPDIANMTVSYQNLRTREKGQCDRKSLAAILLTIK